MVERTIRPDEEGWKKILGGQSGQGEEVKGEDQAPQTSPQTSLEGAVTSTPFPMPTPVTASSRAIGYPLQLRLDVTNHLYELLKSVGSLPQTPAVQSLAQGIKNVENAVAYANAKLLVDSLGLEGFDIRNLSVEAPSKSSAYSALEKFQFVSEIATNPVGVENARNYITALFGPEALKSQWASELASASLEEMVELSTLPQLLPHLQDLSFVQIFGKSVRAAQPFNSAYFIVMEMQPPTIRLLAAKTLVAAYAERSMDVLPQHVFPSGNYYLLKNTSSSEKSGIARLRNEIPVQTLQREAQKLGTGSPQELGTCINAYAKAWQSLLGRLK